MKTKYIAAVVIVIVVVIAAAVLLVSPMVQPAKKLRIAVVFPGDLTDLSFNQTGYESLMRIKEIGYEVTYVSGVYTPADASVYFRSYAAEGYDLIWGHGFQFPEELARIAKDYPNQYFVAGTGTMPEGAPPNFNIIQDAAEEPGYLMGYLAASISKTGKFGFTGAFDAADMGAHKDGFIAGLEAAKTGSSKNMSEIWTNDFHDVSAAKLAAITLADGGADVVSFMGDGITRGATEGCAEKMVWAMPYAGDARSISPNYVLANAVWKWDGPLLEIIHDVEAGTFKSQDWAYACRMASDGFFLLYKTDSIPQDIMNKLESLKNDIIAGKISIPVRTG